MASLQRPPGSDSERQAAEIVAGELEARGAPAWIEHERVHGTFGEGHFGALAREATTFLCLESVGSPELMLLGGEGLLSLYRYPEELIRSLSDLAGELRVRLRDPFRYRLATDGQVALRAGYPTAVISSMDWYKAPSNYHWPSDSPENLCYASIEGAAALALAVVRRLDTLVGLNAAGMSE